MNRAALVTAFLARNGYAAAARLPLAQDASFRRYWRLHGGPRPAVLMDAPPPEDISAFLHIGAHLGGLGLSVPEVLAADETAGLLLLEDLGDDLFPGLLGDQAAPALFEAAVDVLVTIQRAPPPAGLPAWNASAMATTAAATMLDWWWPASFGTPAPASARSAIVGALTTMLAGLVDTMPGFVHRDFFAGNLIWLPGRDGVRRVGVLDFQSAAIGHPAYDLASLIEDARRDLPAGLAERAVSHYLAARPEFEPGRFRAALAVCAAQRHMRVAGQWVRLAQRDARPQYLAYGPRTWARLERALGHPAAAPLAEAFDRWIPPEYRKNPPGLAA